MCAPVTGSPPSASPRTASPRARRDHLSRALKVIDHNRYTIAAAALWAVASLWLAACQSTTAGLADPSKAVDRATFAAQVIAEEADLSKEAATLKAATDAHNAKVEAHNQRVQTGVADLDRQDAMKANIVQALGGAVVQAAAGTINPVGLATTVVSLGLGALGAGAFADKRRADGVIATLKNGSGGHP